MTEIFTAQCALNLIEHTKELPATEHIESIEVRALKITGGDYDEVYNDEEANAFGVYLRYHEASFKELELNPSEWIADFSTRQAAEQFAALLNHFL